MKTQFFLQVCKKNGEGRMVVESELAAELEVMGGGVFMSSLGGIFWWGFECNLTC